MKYLILVLFVFFSVHAVPMNRHVLVLYDSSEDMTDGISPVQRTFELPMNRLGLIAEYADLKIRPLPDYSLFRGIFIWTQDNSVTHPDEVLQWLILAMKSGIKIVTIGGPGALEDEDGNPASIKYISEYEATLGIITDKRDLPDLNPFNLKIIDTVSAFQYETPIPCALSYYPRYVLVQDDISVWRQYYDSRSDTGKIPAVAVSPRGGWVSDPLIIMRMRKTPSFQLWWDLNPFKFLEAVFELKNNPRPDTTTLNGCRAAFSHIDGDAVENVALDLPGDERICGEVVYDEILSKHNIPVTVSFITGVVNKNYPGGERLLKIARKIYELPYIQGASHGYSHPMYWRIKQMGVDLPGYKFSETSEIQLSIAYTNKELLPAGKNTRLFLWTGDCNPGDEALACVQRGNLAAINGGDAIYDDAHPSITSICPLSKKEGEFRQIFACSCNDYIYTNGWKTNFSGFRNVIDTFKRSESPVRFLPINIYYHFFIGERAASLRSIKEVLSWAEYRQLCWIDAIDYHDMVQGFFSCVIEEKNEGYEISDLNAVRTIRFDNCSRYPDFKKSRGILGYNFHGKSLYVHLATDSAFIVLTDTVPQSMNLGSSTVHMKNIELFSQGFSADARWFNTGMIFLQNMNPEEKISVSEGSTKQTYTANEQGSLMIMLEPGNGWKKLTVSRVNSGL